MAPNIRGNDFRLSRSPSEARELRMLREENIRLKKLVADLSLDKVMLQDVLQKEF